MTDAFMVAYGFVGNREDARDLSQDAFIKAYQARDSFETGRPFYPWFYRILKNHCLNFLRRGARRESVRYDADNRHGDRCPSAAPSALESLEAEERVRLMRAAIDRLSDDHREIILLKNFRGHSYQEIAELLSIPIGTVMSRLYYARRALKEIIVALQAEGTDSHPAGEVA